MSPFREGSVWELIEPLRGDVFHTEDRGWAMTAYCDRVMKLQPGVLGRVIEFNEGEANSLLMEILVAPSPLFEFWTCPDCRRTGIWRIECFQMDASVEDLLQCWREVKEGT